MHWIFAFALTNPEQLNVELGIVSRDITWVSVHSLFKLIWIVEPTGNYRGVKLTTSAEFVFVVDGLDENEEAKEDTLVLMPLVLWNIKDEPPISVIPKPK